ncbi:Probable pectinesterase/pectinesterase inhibitor 60 [Linum grandiflorum]
MASIRPLMSISLLIFFSSFLFSTRASLGHEDNVSANQSSITTWCNHTPYPDTCSHYLGQISWPHGKHYPIQKSQFRVMLIEAALKRAVEAEQKVQRWRSKAKDHAQRATWVDCVWLHSSTIRRLNRTLDGLRSAPKSCTNLDAQTWLSSSLTNLETCLTGSGDLNVSSEFVAPMMSRNLTRLISASLAVNGGFLLPQERRRILHGEEEGEEEDELTDRTDSFPKWFGSHERRVLQQVRVGARSVRANVVVARDGSGHFRSVQQAINFAKRRRFKTRFIIRVKRGVYRENIEIDNDNGYIWLIGDGSRYTIITSGRSVGGGYTTFSSATAGIDGPRFVARGITFRNTAGPRKGQAVALRSMSDLSVFYQCSIEGYQDTLFIHSQRQFYRDCYISGTIDFIFGNAAAVFQNCVISPRRPLHGQANMITAQGRNDPFQNTGISIHNSKIVPAPDLRPVVRTVKTYLGRPWMQYARTVVMRSYMDRFIYPKGWSEWRENSNVGIKTLYFGEYKNFGAGASTRYRVRWPGFHAIKSAREASRFSVDGLIAGRAWLSPTGVPYKAGV